MPSVQPNIRVIVVEYDGEDILPRCLASLMENIPQGTPVTLLDNASPTPAESVVPEEIKGRIEIIRLDTNVGYAGAIEKAWSIGDEEFLVIANNDLEFTPGWIEALIDFAVDNNAHAVSAVIEHDNSTELERNSNASLNPLLYLIRGIFTDRTKAVYPSGACFLLRRDRSLISAPVDPDYFLYYEDVYIGFCLRALGKNVVQCPDAVVKHAGSHAVGKADPNMVAFLRERNRLLTQLLFFNMQTLIGLIPVIFFDSLLKIPACWIRGKPVIATLRAHFWVLFNIGSVLRKRSSLANLDGFKRRRILPYLTGKILPPSSIWAGILNAISTGWCRLVGIPVDREAGK